MFWTIPGSLIYEIKFNIKQEMKTFGYLMMTLRLGKAAGHLIAMKICSILKPSRYPDVQLVSLAVQGFGVIMMPLCTTWYLLGICWVIVGMTLGILEANIVFFNSAINKENASKFTNFYYLAFSVGAALTPPIVDWTKRFIDNPKLELAVVCGIVAGTNALMTSFTAVLLKMRRNRGISIGEAEEIVLNKPTEFNAPIISNICVALTACIFMCCRSMIEIFLLPYVLHADANLSEQKAYSVIQIAFGSTMVMRLVGAFISPWFNKTVVSYLMAFLNISLLLGVTSVFVFRDHTYGGIIVTNVVLGTIFGLYQNTLLNWMTDRLALNTRNTASFFVGTCVGSSLTPAIVPHLIKNLDGTINIDSFHTIIGVTLLLAAVFCGTLIITEHIAGLKLKADSVEEIDLKPDISIISRVRYTSLTSFQPSESSAGMFMAEDSEISLGERQDSTATKGRSGVMTSQCSNRRPKTTVTIASSLGHFTPLI